MSAPRPLIGAREVAALLGRSPAWLARARRSLEAAGFPPPLLPGRWPRWDPAAIAAWQDAQMPPSLAAQRARAADPMAQAEQVLLARAMAMAPASVVE
ncbi:helix-turn-helix transcriptional regulator [Rubritepida flocculans]|uniref:helix-turn-helix transcriptional regulator n=1 Tax=Rubritepida flocculans TaxID=182403 RepID=UPI00041BE81A|nr:hypothetical protein [Rubritepida flocculans]